MWDGANWETWMPLGGTTQLAPEPVVIGSKLYVFVRGLDRALYFRVFDGSAWADWTSLGGVIDAASGEG